MHGSANLNLMIRTARRAGRALAKDFREIQNLQASVRGAGDFASRAEAAALKLVRDALAGARPNYGFLSAAADEAGKDPTRRWIAAAPDGMVNYAHGMAHWAVSIALEHKGETVAAVVLDPDGDELFAAEKGQGAWLNNTRLRVSGRRRMEEALFAAGGLSGGELGDMLRDAARLRPACSGLRVPGAASLDLAGVAAGRLDGFWARRADAWSVAAGLLLLREAGGLAEAMEPGGTAGEGGLVAASGELFERFAAVLRRP